MKIKQSQTIEINRSKIKFAPYNPRKKSEAVVNGLKANFKKVGYLGGIVYNKTTGNLVSGHKRVEALDLIHHYDGANDYILKVEEIEVDLQTEKEQNIYMNNLAVQGQFDYEALAIILPDIQIENTGLTDFDLDKISVFTKHEMPLPYKDEPAPQKQATPESIQQLKDLKKDIRENYYDRHDDLTNSHLTIVFDDWAAKVAFLELLEIDIDSKFVKGEEITEKLNLF